MNGKKSLAAIPARKTNGEAEVEANKCGCKSPMLVHENARMLEPLGIHGVSYVSTQCKNCKTQLAMGIKIPDPEQCGIRPDSPLYNMFMNMFEIAVHATAKAAQREGVTLPPSGIVIADS